MLLFYICVSVAEQTAQVVGAGVNESYLYDENGQRLRKTNNLTGVSTFYPFAGYEQTGGLVTKHYSFGGRFVAVRSPSGSLSFLFQDQVSSTVYVTNADGSKQAARSYYDFGVTRYTEGVMPSEYHYTGQREDGTGLYYYGARYYDPDLGNFISPDTVVPDPTKLIDYNRYLYARGNPVKYNDPNGHSPYATDGGGSAPIIRCYSNAYNFATYSSIAAYYHDQGRTWEQLSPDIRLVLESSGYTSYSDLDVGGNAVDTVKDVVNLLPDTGAAAIGATGSAGMGIDGVGNVGVIYTDHEGNIVFGGGSLGVGGNTGANADLGVFLTIMPTASSVDIFNGETVNIGASGGEGPGVGGELNFTKDPATGKPAVGATASIGGSAKVNFPVPPVEFYGNVTKTVISPWRINVFDTLGLPRPD